MLFQITAKQGNPAPLYGVLVHVNDPEDPDSESGVGDRIDFTNLNQAQYNRQLAAGCGPGTGRAAVTAGNITIRRGTPSAAPPGGGGGDPGGGVE
jgi:hypothetical protein